MATRRSTRLASTSRSNAADSGNTRAGPMWSSRKPVLRYLHDRLLRCEYRGGSFGKGSAGLRLQRRPIHSPPKVAGSRILGAHPYQSFNDKRSSPAQSLGRNFVPAISDHQPSLADHLLRGLQATNGADAAGVVESVRSRNEIAVELGLTHRFAISSSDEIKSLSGDVISSQSWRGSRRPARGVS